MSQKLFPFVKLVENSRRCTHLAYESARCISGPCRFWVYKERQLLGLFCCFFGYEIRYTQEHFFFKSCVPLKREAKAKLAELLPWKLYPLTLGFKMHVP